MPIIQFPAFDFDSCASVKVDIVVPESLATPANLFVQSETGVVSSLLIFAKYSLQLFTIHGRSTFCLTSTTRNVTRSTITVSRTNLVLWSSTTLISPLRLATLKLLTSTLAEPSVPSARSVVSLWRTLALPSWPDLPSLVSLMLSKFNNVRIYYYCLFALWPSPIIC